jgi:hypothetical protein
MTTAVREHLQAEIIVGVSPPATPHLVEFGRLVQALARF